MKVVLLHDWLTGFRGGERVLESFCELFPKAPIYTLLHKPNSTSQIIESHPIHCSYLNSLPKVYENYRKFLPLMPHAAESIQLPDDVDLVLSSSHCVIKGVPKPKGAKHICYIHSPMRYMYDQYDAYFGSHAPFYQRWGAKLFKNYLVTWDLRSNKNVDSLVANSHFVQKRIQRFYQLESEVIHPFVELEDFLSLPEDLEKQDYFIMLTAFAPNKRVDLAIEAFNQLGKRLKIIGSGQQEEWLKSMAKTNIEFLGSIPREKVIHELARAQAMIFPGVEDFGITPLEAMASGTPVIALKKGGVLETLTQETAIFFEEESAQSLIAGVKKFDLSQFSREKLKKRAHDFSKDQFKAKIKNHIEKVMNEN